MAKLSDVCYIQAGGTPSRSYVEYWKDGNIPWVKISDIKGKKLYITEEKITELGLEKSSAKLFPKGTILYSIFATLGEVAILDIDATTNQAIAGLQLIDDSVLPDYLYYFLVSKKDFVNNIGRGVAQNNINLKILRDMAITIPSKKEQKDIILRLNTINQSIEWRKQQLSKLDELVKARFIEMFGLPVSNTMKWETEKMQSIAPSQNYLGEMPDEVWLLNLDMIESQTGRIIDYLIVPKDEVGNSTCIFDDSTVLYSKLRPYLNKVVIPNRCGYATSELVPLKPNSFKLNREYLAYMLRSDDFVTMISDKVAGAKMPRVSMNDFRNFEVPIPPIELQNEFAAFVKQIDKSKLEIQQSLEKLETLKKSLMQQYFG